MKKLADEFSGVASWAIWADEEAGKPKSNIGDLTIFENVNLDCLHSGYVFVGLNAAKHEVDNIPKCWSAFHSEDIKRQQDYKLRYALRGTKYWGSYITDIIKNYPETQSNKVEKMLKQHPEILDNNIKKLKEELVLLDKPAVIVAIGNKSYKILQKALGDEFRIVKIMHYSSFINRDNYRKKVLEVLDEVIID